MAAKRAESREQLEALHTPEAIRRRLEAGGRDSVLKDLIYGAIDGAVTTFAIVAGVAGAGLSPVIVIILGAANLLADGFSMAAANFLGTRAENQQLARARAAEAHHILVHPEGERQEIRQIFAGKGFEGETLEQIVETLTADHKQWIDTMIVEEHGLSVSPRSAWRAAIATFVAFVIVGAIPLLPYLAILGTGTVTRDLFLFSCVMTGVAFAAVGAMKSRFVDQRWWVAAIETLAIGGAAAVLAYGIGWLLAGVA